jgi:Indoleamine 2,3-dioxygenase.
VLDNWAEITPGAAITLNNLRMLQPFLGGQDEAWFVLIHVAIEAVSGEVLAAIPALIKATNHQNEQSKGDSGNTNDGGTGGTTFMR